MAGCAHGADTAELGEVDGIVEDQLLPCDHAAQRLRRPVPTCTRSAPQPVSRLILTRTMARSRHEGRSDFCSRVSVHSLYPLLQGSTGAYVPVVGDRLAVVADIIRLVRYMRVHHRPARACW